MDNKSLYDKETAIKFYGDRYSQGYMDEWPVEKKQRVFEIIKNLPLPPIGDALDFGCGNGVFTETIKQALPNWNVYGCDISKVAIKNATKRFPNCNFFISNSNTVSNRKFDFLFSHHVLEHVFDIRKAIDEMNNYIKQNSFMLHILPCGNKNSFEYNVCKMRKDSIKYDMEGRFFFEDEGHVRRLTTNQLTEYLEKYSFKILKDYYSNQYYGAIKWISRCDKNFIFNFANPSMALNAGYSKELKKIKIKLLFVHFCNNISCSEFRNHLRNTYYGGRQIIMAIIKICFYPLARAISFYYDNKANQEWKEQKEKKNGSEMYVFYRR
ncbi:MAG TPA: class I SAM-dependent methyltransferase [Nitrospinota bacterium]|nr:class I SAM-dependent methyltransferase [Nitrospinota bacterium]